MMATKSRAASPFPNENQLSLFSDLSEPELADNLGKEPVHVGNGNAHASRPSDLGTLETPPPQDGGEPGERESPSASDLRSTGIDQQSPVRVDGSEKDGIPPGLGNRDEGMGISPGRGEPASVVVRSSDARSATTPARDFRISPAHQIGEGSLKQKAQANLAAIRALKIIESENRPATPEEKAVLVKYVGWGAMPNAFGSLPPQEWQNVASELKNLLNPEEYASARASTPNAHYTSPEVIEAIWRAMEQFGVQPGAHILEPSVGVGHFFGLMPERLYPGARRTGVELDSITARIAAHLYPESTVHQKGFEDPPFPKDYFDAAVGNIPFGNYPVYDPAYRGRPYLTHAIHDYFLAKCLDVVRPGGLLALITSRYTMDKQDSTVRQHLAEQSTLLGAIRLPNTTFKGNAGTEVTTDILFLQKRCSDDARGENWTELKAIDTPDGPIQVNEYFARHLDMMLGRMGLESGQYGDAPVLIGTLHIDDLGRAVSWLPAHVYKSRENQAPLMRPDSDQVPAAGTVKEGGLADRGGQIVVCRRGVLEQLAVPASVAARIRGMLQVRDAVRDVFRTQLVDAPEETIAEARGHLNRTYDSFVSRFGPLSVKENVKAFAGDPDQPLLLSLEEFDPETRRATKTAVFERRTLERYRPVERVESASEALLVSLNETGQISWPRMESLTGRPGTE